MAYSLPSTATLDQSVTISWSNGDPFSGFLLIGLVLPTGSPSVAELDLQGEAPGERIPIFTKVPVVAGKFDNTVGIIYNTSIAPPNSKYACWYYDQAAYPVRQVAGPSTLFTVTSATLTPPSLTLTAPTAGTVAPTPDA